MEPQASVQILSLSNRGYHWVALSREARMTGSDVGGGVTILAPMLKIQRIMEEEWDHVGGFCSYVREEGV